MYVESDIWEEDQKQLELKQVYIIQKMIKIMNVDDDLVHNMFSKVIFWYSLIDHLVFISV